MNIFYPAIACQLKIIHASTDINRVVKPPHSLLINSPA